MKRLNVHTCFNADSVAPSIALLNSAHSMRSIGTEYAAGCEGMLNGLVPIERHRPHVFTGNRLRPIGKEVGSKLTKMYELSEVSLMQVSARHKYSRIKVTLQHLGIELSSIREIS